MPHEPKKPSHKPPAASRRKQGFGREFVVSMAAHIIAPLLLAVASAAWLYFEKDPSVPQGPFLLFVLLTIVLAYFALIALQYFFHEDFALSRRPRLHIAIAALFVVTVTAPLALTSHYTTTQMNKLAAQVNKAETDLKNERETQAAMNEKRIQLYKQVTDPVARLLGKSGLDNEDLKILLDYCIQSIKLTKSPTCHLRGTVVFLDETGSRLAMPQGAYSGFDSDIKGLFFDVSPQRDSEDKKTYRERVGVAGWSYITKQPIRDEDVQEMLPGEEHIYKPFPASAKDESDRAIICVNIPDLTAERSGRPIGVLSISSPMRGVLNESDLNVARFFATLLGKFKTPIKTPQFIQEEERSGGGK